MARVVKPLPRWQPAASSPSVWLTLTSWMWQWCWHQLQVGLGRFGSFDFNLLEPSHHVMESNYPHAERGLVEEAVSIKVDLREYVNIKNGTEVEFLLQIDFNILSICWKNEWFLNEWKSNYWVHGGLSKNSILMLIYFTASLSEWFYLRETRRYDLVAGGLALLNHCVTGHECVEDVQFSLRVGSPANG